MGRQGISSAALARKLSVSEAWTSRRVSVTGDQTMDLEDVERVAEALGVAVKDLLLGPANQGSQTRPITRHLAPRPRLNDRPNGRPASRAAAAAPPVALTQRRPAPLARRASIR